MNRQDLPRWNYFRLLERDIEACFRYVEPCEKHYAVYSDEFSKLILVACSEIENSLHELAGFISGPGSRNNIKELKAIVLARFPHMPLARVSVARYGLTLEPWKDWAESPPDWWANGYNKIKHDRGGNPEAGTLLRALNAMAALQVILLYLYKHKYRVAEIPIEASPHLLDLVEQEGEMTSGSITWSWELPDDEYAIQKRARARQLAQADGPASGGPAA